MQSNHLGRNTREPDSVLCIRYSGAMFVIGKQNGTTFLSAKLHERALAAYSMCRFMLSLMFCTI